MHKSNFIILNLYSGALRKKIQILQTLSPNYNDLV